MAGVSLATASRVANGATAVRPATRARVERAMRELMYVASPRSGTLSAIGLLVPELANPIFPALAEAMEACAAEHQLATILCNTGGSAANEIEYGQMLLGREVEGMLFISSEATDLRGEHGHYTRLVEAGAKIVFVNGAVPTLDVASVGIDERSAGEVATRHLIELGHERIGFVAGPEYSRATIEKATGSEMALRAAALAIDGLVAHADWGVAGGKAAMQELLALDKQRPTGVICSSDLMAIGALLAAREAGVAVPGELSIVGFDGIQGGEWTDPPLTTLVQPIDELASAAVETLRLLFSENARRVPHLVFRPQLLVRGSTARA